MSTVTHIYKDISLYSVIVRVRVVLKRTVVGDTNNSSFQNYPRPDDHTI